MVNIIITVKIGFSPVIAQAQLMIRSNIIINLQADGFTVDIALPFFTGAILKVTAVLIIIINMVAYLALTALGIQLILSGTEIAAETSMLVLLSLILRVMILITPPLAPLP